MKLPSFLALIAFSSFLYSASTPELVAESEVQAKACESHLLRLNEITKELPKDHVWSDGFPTKEMALNVAKEMLQAPGQPKARQEFMDQVLKKKESLAADMKSAWEMKSCKMLGYFNFNKALIASTKKFEFTKNELKLLKDSVLHYIGTDLSKLSGIVQLSIDMELFNQFLQSKLATGKAGAKKAVTDLQEEWQKTLDAFKAANKEIPPVIDSKKWDELSTEMKDKLVKNQIKEFESVKAFGEKLKSLVANKP